MTQGSDAPPSGRAGAADHYELFGIRLSLATDSMPVRDFFRACYRNFQSDFSSPADLELQAWLKPGSGPPRVVAGGVTRDLSGHPLKENQAFLYLLNALMDRVAEFLLIHGAAVSVAGRGIILAGPPTAGKSTLVMEMARRGGAFLSDDVAPIHRATGALHPFPRAVGIRADSGIPMQVDPARLAPDMAHRLAHKWLVQPQALGLKVLGPENAPCPVDVVVLLDPGMGGEGEGEKGARHRWELALADSRPEIISAVAAIRGVRALREESWSDFPRYTFETDPGEGPMQAVSDLCRRNPEVILYLDEARLEVSNRPQEPILRHEAPSSLLMPIARDLLNRSETGALLRSCGGLPGLLMEVARVLQGASTYRLRAGDPGRTADLVLSLTQGPERPLNAGQAPTGGR